MLTRFLPRWARISREYWVAVGQAPLVANTTAFAKLVISFRSQVKNSIGISLSERNRTPLRPISFISIRFFSSPLGVQVLHLPRMQSILLLASVCSQFYQYVGKS